MTEGVIWPTYRKHTDPPPQRAVMTMQEIADKYGVSKGTVQGWRENDLLPEPCGFEYFGTARAYVYRIEEVEEAVEEAFRAKKLKLKKQHH